MHVISEIGSIVHKLWIFEIRLKIAIAISESNINVDIDPIDLRISSHRSHPTCSCLLILVKQVACMSRLEH